mmetsp:Transcript_892/g.2706  ORF Transcript_892/g.2706 Transcript_892/m.2706 type:complete len:110 (-) Transcript_892:414-743(-)
MDKAMDALGVKKAFGKIGVGSSDLLVGYAALRPWREAAAELMGNRSAGVGPFSASAGMPVESRPVHTLLHGDGRSSGSQLTVSISTLVNAPAAGSGLLAGGPGTSAPMV